ncbi:MAG: hypothetical protein WBJ44_07425 [Propionicimonas sp.]
MSLASIAIVDRSAASTMVDFLVGVLGAKVPDAGVGRFGVDPHTDWAVNGSKCVRCHRKPSQV